MTNYTVLEQIKAIRQALDQLETQILDLAPARPPKPGPKGRIVRYRPPALAGNPDYEMVLSILTENRPTGMIKPHEAADIVYRHTGRLPAYYYVKAALTQLGFLRTRTASGYRYEPPNPD